MRPSQATETEAFRKGLASSDLKALRAVPKSDLHIHSILGTHLERIESWVGSSLTRPPARMSYLNEMVNYAHGTLYPHIMTRAGFEFAARSAILDAFFDGVEVIEMSVDVRFMNLYDDSADDFLGFIESLTPENKGAIQVRPEIGMSEDRPAPEQVQVATVCINSGLFRSIDLYGNETAQPPESFRRACMEAHAIVSSSKPMMGSSGDPRASKRH